MVLIYVIYYLVHGKCVFIILLSLNGTRPRLGITRREIAIGTFTRTHATRLRFFLFLFTSDGYFNIKRLFFPPKTICPHSCFYY